MVAYNRSGPLGSMMKFRDLDVFHYGRQQETRNRRHRGGVTVRRAKRAFAAVRRNMGSGMDVSEDVADDDQQQHCRA